MLVLKHNITLYMSTITLKIKNLPSFGTNIISNLNKQPQSYNIQSLFYHTFTYRKKKHLLLGV